MTRHIPALLALGLILTSSVLSQRLYVSLRPETLQLATRDTCVLIAATFTNVGESDLLTYCLFDRWEILAGRPVPILDTTTTPIDDKLGNPLGLSVMLQDSLGQVLPNFSPYPNWENFREWRSSVREQIASSGRVILAMQSFQLTLHVCLHDYNFFGQTAGRFSLTLFYMMDRTILQYLGNRPVPPFGLHESNHVVISTGD